MSGLFTEAQTQELAGIILRLLAGVESFVVIWLALKVSEIRAAQKENREREAEKEAADNERKRARKQRITDAGQLEANSLPSVRAVDKASGGPRPAQAPESGRD